MRRSYVVGAVILLVLLSLPTVVLVATKSPFIELVTGLNPRINAGEDVIMKFHVTRNTVGGELTIFGSAYPLTVDGKGFAQSPVISPPDEVAMWDATATLYEEGGLVWTSEFTLITDRMIVWRYTNLDGDPEDPH